MLSSDLDSDSTSCSSKSTDLSLSVTSDSETSVREFGEVEPRILEEIDLSDSEDLSQTELSSSEVRRQYSKLIETCQGLEDREGFEGNLDEIIKSNIVKASELFDRMMTHGTVSQGTSQTQNSTQFGGGPGDMYMAFLHTKMCSGMIKYKSDSIGSATSGFKVEDFLSSLKRKSAGESGEFSVKVAARSLAVESASASKTLPQLVAVVGTFDKDAVSVPKQKKQRAPTRKKLDETAGHEEVTLAVSDKNRLGREKTAPESVAQHLNKILRYHSLTQGKPTNLFEFILDPTSLNKSIEYLFYVGFLVQDGYASLTREGDSRTKNLALQLRPEKPVDKKEKQKQQVGRKSPRNQYILSFSPRLYKRLCKVAEGDPIIPTYKNFTDWGED